MPETCELLLEAVKYIRVAYCISTHQCYLRQIASLQYICGLLGDIYDILQHLELWTVSHSSLNIECWTNLHHWDVLLLLVSKHHWLAKRQTAKLVEQHARKNQSVVNLAEGHLGLVNLHVNAQSVATCSNALVYHLMNIAVELLYQLQIALSQLLLVVERYHLPVGLVNLIESGMTTGIHLVLSHLGVDISNLVKRHNATTHKHWLGNNDGACKDIAGISAEGINDALSLAIKHANSLAKHLS